MLSIPFPFPIRPLLAATVVAVSAMAASAEPLRGVIDAETLERITAALDGGASKASVCRTFKVPRSTLLGTLARIGWTAPAKV